MKAGLAVAGALATSSFGCTFRTIYAATIATDTRTKNTATTTITITAKLLIPALLPSLELALSPEIVSVSAALLVLLDRIDIVSDRVGINGEESGDPR